MAVSGIGKMAAKATGTAAGALGELMGTGTYPESEYGLAAYLFERIAHSEKETAVKDRQYFLDLMATCLKTVRDRS